MDDEPKHARKVSIASCGCPHVYIRLWDENGQCYAVASLPLETALAVSADIASNVEQRRKGVPTVCEAVH